MLTEYPYHTVLDTRWMDNDAYGHVNNVVYYSFTAGLKVVHIGTSSVRYEIGLFRNDEPEPAAAGFFVHVYTDRATRRPTPIPDDVRQALVALNTQ